jgi:hypothetical protein
MTTNRISTYYSRGDQPQPRQDIACPECGFAPCKGMIWMCAPDGCGGAFDTFETRAKCPHCEAQFAWTQCLSCGKVSTHKAWYRRSAS